MNLIILLTSLQSNNKFSVTVNQANLETTEQVAHFSDQAPQWDYVVDSMPDATYGQADSTDAELGNFFGRPIKVFSTTWSTGATLFLTFNPWESFFENPRVMNRISNFNLLRSKLHVRFVVNGNGFYYGRAIASYNPLHNFDDFTLDRSTVPQDTIGASQRPHVYLDPTNSQGGSLCLPFFWPENALSIPLLDWQQMGEITIRQMQPLKHANGATDPITISCFVWAEDVNLSIPTSVNPFGLVPQAGDEYSDGPISGPAGVVRRVANRLTDIPVIGAYARATAIASGAVSNIASLFGYSRPVSLETSLPFVPHLFGNMANANVKDPSTKLTLDIKQELTVDPRTMGLGDVDEMTISSISQRESYLTNFPWAVSDPTETKLWNTYVTPVNWDVFGDEIHLPPCAFATLPFKWWRGSIKYRFQIVASAFHKGRLKIVYDPNPPDSNEYNTNYTYILDIAKERDFTVTIGWGSTTAFLRHDTPGVDPPGFTTGVLPASPGGFQNGVLTVYVVNDLTVPNSTVNNDISVNVFISTGDDFEVAEPSSTDISKYVHFDPSGAEAFAAGARFPPELTLEEFEERNTPALHSERIARSRRALLEAQAGEEDTSATMNQPDSDLTKNESIPMKEDISDAMAPKMNPMDNAFHVFFADPVTSFRQCLKRYGYHSSATAVGNTNRFFIYNMPDFPYYRGYAPGAVNLSSDPAPDTPYSFAKTTLLNYLTPAFEARRGGLRWKHAKNQGLDLGLAMVSRIPDNDAVGYDAVEILATGGTGAGYDNGSARDSSTIWPHLWDGGIANNTEQNSILEVELPYYSTFRFSPGKQADWTSPFTPYNSYHRYVTMGEKNGALQTTINRFVATGEDFTLNFFTGCPRLFYTAAEPAA